MTYDHHGTLQRYFAGLAEYTFETQLGLADPALVDYVTELLLRFLRSDLSALGPQRVDEVGRLLWEAQQQVGEAQRELYRRVGDVALFWTGVYPEALKKRRAASVDLFADTCTQGKRSYYLASTLRTEAAEQQCELLERLSANFELCAYGLSELRREWERRGDDGADSGGPLILG